MSKMRIASKMLSFCLGVLALASPPAVSAQATQGIAEARALLHEAAELVPQIEQVQQTSAASNIAAQQVKAGDLAGALETLHRVEKPIDEGILYYGASFALTARGDWATAMQILGGLPDGASNSSSYTAVVVELAKQHDFKNAHKVARMIADMPDAVPRFVDALLFICVERWKRGDKAESFETLNEALYAVDKLELASDRAANYAAERYAGMADFLAFSGDVSAASAVIERLRMVTNEGPDPAVRSRAVRLLAESLARIGNFGEALSVAKQLPPTAGRDAAMIQIACQQATQGDPSGARVLVSQVQPKEWNNQNLKQFASALARAGDSTGAVAIVRMIEKTADRASGFAEVALEQAGQKDSAAILTVTLAMEEVLRDRTAIDPFVLQLIAVTQGELGNFPGALEILRRLDGRSRQWPLWSITESLVEAGKKNEAIALARAEEDAFPRAYALLGTATVLLEQRDSGGKKVDAAR
jgi:tetratricopeptide (TPR) repeat protein